MRSVLFYLPVRCLGRNAFSASPPCFQFLLSPYPKSAPLQGAARQGRIVSLPPFRPRTLPSSRAAKRLTFN